MKRIVQGLSIVLLMYGSMAQAWYVNNVGDKPITVLQGTSVMPAWQQRPGQSGSGSNVAGNQLTSSPFNPVWSEWGYDGQGYGMVDNPNANVVVQPGDHFNAGPSTTVVVIQGGNTQIAVLGPISSPGTNDNNGGLLVSVVTGVNGFDTINMSLNKTLQCNKADARFGSISNTTNAAVTVRLKYSLSGGYKDHTILPGNARNIETVSSDSQCLESIQIIAPKNTNALFISADSIRSKDQNSPTSLEIIKTKSGAYVFAPR